MEISPRKGTNSDLPRVVRIYNHGIEERTATFETKLKEEADVKPWVDSPYPFVVAECSGIVESFAVAFPYSSRDCYRTIAEFSVYVSKPARGQGLGRAVMTELISECEKNGFTKLLSRVFTDNLPSRNLLRSLGFREVGIYEKHGKLDGKWRDTVIVEYLISRNLD